MVVANLWRYPVKSMLGEECTELALDARGVAGDRLYAVRDSAGRLGSGKTTRRFRQLDGLFGFRATGDEVVFPDGRKFKTRDPDIHAALSSVLGVDVRVEKEKETPHLDAGPVHIVSTGALDWLRSRLPDASIDERRFRPNLVIQAGGEIAVGKVLQVGAQAQLHVLEPTERCRMTTLAQGDLPADARVLRCLSEEKGMCFGVYAEVVAPGVIRRGDAVI
jgi:uncharacterized protein YcbX